MSAAWGKPQQIDQLAENDCLTCVVAQILCMSGESTQSDVDRLHQELGGKPDEAVPLNNAILFLLERGFRVRTICEWSDAQFVRQGLPYLRAFYGRRWTRALRRQFTPELVAQERRAARQATQRIASFGGLYQQTRKTATASDLRRLLGAGYVVIAVLELGELQRHAVLLYGIHHERTMDETPGEAPYVTAYHPDRRATFQEFALADISCQLSAEYGVTAVQLPTSRAHPGCPACSRAAGGNLSTPAAAGG